MHDLAVLDGNDGDEAVVVGGTGPDYFTVYLVFNNHDTGILRSVRYKRIRAMQEDVAAIAHKERHERLPTIKSLGPSWEDISKLEHRVMGNGIEIMVAVDQAGQTLLDYVEERVERSKGRYLGSLIIYSKLVDVPRLWAAASVDGSERSRSVYSLVAHASLTSRRYLQPSKKYGLDALFLRLRREQQWVAQSPARIRRVRCLGFRYILRVDGNDTHGAYAR